MAALLACANSSPDALAVAAIALSMHILAGSPASGVTWFTWALTCSLVAWSWHNRHDDSDTPVPVGVS